MAKRPPKAEADICGYCGRKTECGRVHCELRHQVTAQPKGHTYRDSYDAPQVPVGAGAAYRVPPTLDSDS